jgi:hypothetical protein
MMLAEMAGRYEIATRKKKALNSPKV